MCRTVPEDVGASIYFKSYKQKRYEQILDYFEI